MLFCCISLSLAFCSSTSRKKNSLLTWTHQKLSKKFDKKVFFLTVLSLSIFPSDFRSRRSLTAGVGEHRSSLDLSILVSFKFLFFTLCIFLVFWPFLCHCISFITFLWRLTRPFITVLILNTLYMSTNN